MDGFNEFERDLLKLANTFEKGKYAKQHLRREGNKLKRVTIKLAQQRVKIKTGNYIKGTNRGKVYFFKGTRALSVRVYGGHPANHAHLIEYGHRRVARDGSEHGFTHGKYIFEKAIKSFEDKYVENSQKFIDKLIDKHGF